MARQSGGTNAVDADKGSDEDVGGTITELAGSGTIRSGVNPTREPRSAAAVAAIGIAICGTAGTCMRSAAIAKRISLASLEAWLQYARRNQETR